MSVMIILFLYYQIIYYLVGWKVGKSDGTIIIVIFVLSTFKMLLKIITQILKTSTTKVIVII